MSQKFQASVQHRGDVSYVKLGGVIDEDNELADLVDKIPTGTAVIDLGEIERINSCGVRDWVNWLSKLEGNGTRSVLVECSPAIVAQINLVNNFTGSGVVKSFYVPYFCPECDEEKVLLVEASDMGPPPHEPPTCRCDECDLVMDFDDMPDSYFAFLSQQRKLVEPEKISGAMRDLGRGDADGNRGRVRSRASQPNLAAGALTAQGQGSAHPAHPSHPAHPAHPSHPARLSHSSPPAHPAHPAAPAHAAVPASGPHALSGAYAHGPKSSVPSLPSIQRTSTAPIYTHAGQTGVPAQAPPGYSGRNLAAPAPAPSRPQLGTKPPTGPGPMIASASRPPGALPAPAPGAAPSNGYAYAPAPGPAAAPPRGNALVYALIGVLLVAIGVLAYLVLTK